jgi:ABC-type branched-subunit amino acid transport system substrate-binding protein
MLGLRRGALVALVAMLAVAPLAGCNGDGTDDPAPGPTRSGSSGILGRAPTGAAIRLMAMTAETGAVVTPEVLSAARAAAAGVNADGGVGGHQIEIVACDTHSTPADAADCARRAVTEKVGAVVGPIGPGGADVLPILAAAGIPVVANTADSRVEATDPDSFPLNATALQLVAAAAVVKSAGAEAVQYLGPDTADYRDALATARGLLGEVGIRVKGSTLYPAGPGISDSVAKAYRSGADAVVVDFASTTAVPAFATALDRGGFSFRDTPTATLGTTFRPSVLTGDVADALDGLFVVNGGQTPTDDRLPAIKTFHQEYAVSSGRIEYTDAALAAWVGVHAIAKVLRGAPGDITRADTLREALAKSPIDYPGWMPFGFSAPALVGALGDAFPRVGSNTTWVSRVAGDRLVAAVDEPQPFTGPVELAGS